MEHDRDFEKCPNGWNIRTVGSTIRLVKDQVNPEVEQECRYIGLEHIEQGTLHLSSVGSSRDVKSNKYKFKTSQILFGKLRPYFRKLYIPKFDGVCSTDIWVIEPRQGFDNKFMFYFLADERIIQKLTGSSEGTRMPRARWDYLVKLSYPMPQLQEQRNIGVILSSIDDKIELNRQMNATLEQIAQALFRHWFADFEFPNEEGKPYKTSGGKMIWNEEMQKKVPEGWEVKNISEVARVKIGRTPPRKESEWFSDKEGVKWASIKDLGNARMFILNTSERLTEEAVKKFRIPKIRAGTIMLSFKLTLGRVSIATEEMVSNEAIAQFDIDDGDILRTYLYEYLSQFDFTTLGSTSSIATAVNSESIRKMRILVPQSKIQVKYEKEVENIFGYILKKTYEIESLTHARESLLPKLMSGEIRVGGS